MNIKTKLRCYIFKTFKFMNVYLGKICTKLKNKLVQINETSLDLMKVKICLKIQNLNKVKKKTRNL